MKRILFLAVMTVAVFLVVPKMYSQNKHLRLRFHVPFSFSANNQTFKPGEYEFTQQSLLVFKVANLKSNDSAFESVLPAQSHKESNGQVKLVFHRYGNQYFLAAVSFGSWESSYDFETSAEEKRLADEGPRKPMMSVTIDPGGTVLLADRGRN